MAKDHESMTASELRAEIDRLTITLREEQARVNVGWAERKAAKDALKRKQSVDRLAARPKRMTGHTLYWTWKNILDRCLNPSCKSYPRYGGRGIDVCERWLTFENFIADMGPRPNGYSIDRIDNNGSYAPENCRWADNYTQHRNRRDSRFLEFDGERLTVTDWAMRLGMSRTAIFCRLNLGWTVERTLTTPVKKMVRKKRIAALELSPAVIDHVEA